MNEYDKITEEEVRHACSLWLVTSTEDMAIYRLTELANGNHTIEEFREDILSFRE